MLASATLGLLLAASDAIRWNAAVETSARGRNEPTVDGRGRSGELELRAQLEVSAAGPDGAAALTYLPSLVLRQASSGLSGAGDATQQGGRLELRTRLAPATRLAWRTLLEWGLTDFSPLSGQLAPPVAGQLPSQRFVRTLGIDTMLDLTHGFSRRLQLSVAAGLQRSGGVGHDAVSVLPFQLGPQATALLTWAADRGDVVTVLGSVAESRFSIDITSVYSELRVGWSRRTSSHTLVETAAGLVFVHSSGPDSSSKGTYGAGAAGIVWNLPMAPRGSLRTSLHLRLLPGVDRITALAIQTVRGEGTTELTEGRLRVGVFGSQARVISGSGEGANELRLEARSSWLAARAWTLQGGLGAARTNQLPFTGWQFQALVGLRCTADGWF